MRDKIAVGETAQRQNDTVAKAHSREQPNLRAVQHWKGIDVAGEENLNNQFVADNYLYQRQPKHDFKNIKASLDINKKNLLEMYCFLFEEALQTCMWLK